MTRLWQASAERERRRQRGAVMVIRVAVEPQQDTPIDWEAELGRHERGCWEGHETLNLLEACYSTEARAEGHWLKIAERAIFAVAAFLAGALIWLFAAGP